MKKISSSLTLLATALLLAVMSASCSHDTNKLLETIPSTANFVADVDLPEVLKGLGAEVSDREIIVPDSMKFLTELFGEHTPELINNCYQAFDTGHFVFFQDSITGNSIITMLIRDKSFIDKIFEDSPVETKNGYKICTNSSGVTMLTKKNQFWALKSDNAVEEIENILDAAKESNIGQKEGLSEFLEREGCASVISNIDGFGTIDQWSCMSLVVKNNNVIINSQLMSTDGEIIEFNGLQPLQTDFLRYIPANMNFVAAIGATRNTDWGLLDKIVSTCDNTQLVGLFDTLMPYLHSADGTIAIATTIDTDDIMDSGASFFVMIHLPRYKINEGLNEIEQQINSAGAKAVRDEQGNISLSGQGMSFYAANIDGYLGIATFPLTPTRNNEFAPYFVNRKAGVYINLPTIPMLQDSPGLIVDLQVQTAAASLSVKCPQGITTLLNFLFALAL